MPSILNRQSALKPQDLFVLLAMVSRGEEASTYSQVAETTGLAASAVHASVKRAVASRLAAMRDGKPVVLKAQLKEFLVHGAKYAFPALLGPTTRGVPTAHAVAPLKDLFVATDELPPVWPHPNGPVRGVSLAPLYPSVPEAAMQNEKLHRLLSLFDAIRAGQAREREAAARLLGEQLA